ncbi:sensor histidine kinase [Nocardia sp. NPDC052566]|uniref:sensor histidine kinase n=1 Tax=Nocardia sp. NPDC052566 TaxID=3364330 RepID=UPI0037CC491D
MKYWSGLSATAQDALVVGSTFLLGVGLYLAGFYQMAGSSTATPLLTRFGVLALMCGAGMLRRRAPITALCAGIVPVFVDLWIGASVPIWILYSDLIYAAVLYARRDRSRYVVWLCGVLSAAVTITLLVVTGDWRVMALAVVAAFAFVGTPIWWALSVRQHKEIADAERARAQAMSLVAELDRRAAIADERKTMARDLHDVIAGHLSAIAIQSEAALGVLARTEADPAIAGILGSIRSNSVSALQEMRTMIGLLRRDDGAEDDAAAPRGLAQLPILVDAARAAGITVRVRAELDGAELPSAVDQAAYRIAQEALTNAMKHAPGQEVDIHVSTQAATVALSVRNPTAGTRAHPADSESRHRGLMNMRERAAALGGTFTAGAQSGTWAVEARLPLTAAEVGS